VANRVSAEAAGSGLDTHVRDARVRMGRTQDELGRELGASRQAVSAAGAGGSQFTASEIVALSALPALSAVREVEPARLITPPRTLKRWNSPRAR